MTNERALFETAVCDAAIVENREDTFRMYSNGVYEQFIVSTYWKIWKSGRAALQQQMDGDAK